MYFVCSFLVVVGVVVAVVVVFGVVAAAAVINGDHDREVFLL